MGATYRRSMYSSARADNPTIKRMTTETLVWRLIHLKGATNPVLVRGSREGNNSPTRSGHSAGKSARRDKLSSPERCVSIEGSDNAGDDEPFSNMSTRI